MHLVVRVAGVFVFALVILLPAMRGAEHPNILFVLADDVGREVLGCYGGTSYQSPNIDQLAADGVQFVHYYTMPVCHPTRLSLLTGQYPFRLGHPEWGTFPRPVEDRTLANVLKRAGYATAIAGKWQLVLLKDDLQQPNRMGFDEYCLYGWHEGPWYYQPHIWQNGQRRADIRERYGPDVTCEFIINFIERHRARPFFAFYSMELCHSETNDLPEPAPVGPKGRYNSYAELVAKMDENVGRVVATIDRLGLRETTLIVFTSDNGTASQHLIDAEDGQYIYEPVVSKIGERDVPGGKATLLDGGTRVPFIACWPGTIKSGQVNNDLMDVTDIHPSLANLAGAKLPKDVTIDGKPLLAQIQEGAQPRRSVFAEHEGKCFVRDQRWKLYSDGRFHDMDADPDEKKPLTKDALPHNAAAALGELQRAFDELNYRPR